MKNIVYFFILGFFLFSCTATNKAKTVPPAFDAQAHRGGKGLMPENTIPAMLHAIDLNVNTLEMDLQVTKDRQVIVSHDASFNHNFTTTPDGKTLTPEESKKLLLYEMNYDDIKKYDVGMKYFADVPRQKKIAVQKPLLSDLLEATEKYAKQKGRVIFYNIEIKSNAKNDGKLHPPVEEFADLALKVILASGAAERVTIQSFDNRALQIVHKKYPQVKTSLLIEAKDKRSLDQQIKDLGFTPDAYSPHFSIVTQQLIQQCHQKNIKVIAWTVNDLDGLRRLKNMGIDAIISDYPDLFAQM